MAYTSSLNNTVYWFGQADHVTLKSYLGKLIDVMSLHMILLRDHPMILLRDHPMILLSSKHPQK